MKMTTEKLTKEMMKFDTRLNIIEGVLKDIATCIDQSVDRGKHADMVACQHSHDNGKVVIPAAGYAPEAFRIPMHWDVAERLGDRDKRGK